MTSNAITVSPKYVLQLLIYDLHIGMTGLKKLGVSLTIVNDDQWESVHMCMGTGI